MILNAPENPTGGVTSQADLERAAAAITQTPAWVLTDEVYSRITYDVEAPSIASLPGLLERTVLLDGFSKTFAMTGWRLGYAAVPTELVDPLTRLIVNSTSYAFPNVLELPIGADELADRLLDEVGVAVLSGTSFGGYGDGHLRISYASSLTNLEQAVERIRHFAAAL